MKNIDEIYKEWSGKSHIENSCKEVHDSAEAQDFAIYYHNEMKQSEDVVLDGVSVSFEVGEKVLHTTRTEVEVSAFCEDKEQIEVNDGCDWYRVDKDELSKIHSR